ncbi:MAG: 2'-5' RNA ligase family protein [Sciscionella sp.]|nr:2'-5' RNA ligase family protein [Sciscionella sp.]
MAYALEMFFDTEADNAVRELWQRLENANIPSLASRTHRKHRPHSTLAIAGGIPASTRTELTKQLRMLALPNLWLYTLGTFPTKENALFLAAVVDTELLAVHSAVHDTLAGKVKNPLAYYLPGAWVPHCGLAQNITNEQLSSGFSLLHPIDPISARIAEVGITNTGTGEVEKLIKR